MVSIAQALQQTEEAGASALKRERQIEEAEARARRIRIGGTIAEQFRFGAGLPRARRGARRQREEALAEIGIARGELATFRGSLAERRREIERVQAQQRAAGAFNRDLATARALQGRGARGALLVSQESKRVQRLFQQVKEGRRFVGAPAAPTELEGFVGVSALEGPAFVPIGGADVFRPIQTLQTGGLLLQEIPEAPKVTVFDLLPTPSREPPRRDIIQRALTSPFIGVGGVSATSSALQRQVLGTETVQRIIATGLFGDLPAVSLVLVDPLRRKAGLPELFPEKETFIPTFRDVRTALERGIPPEEKKQLASFFADVSLFSPLSVLSKERRKEIGMLGVETLSFVIESFAPRIPVTPLGISSFVAAPLAFKAVSPFLRTVGVTAFGGLETKAFIEAETPQEKFAAGVGVGLAATGLAFETFPFVRGSFAKGARTTVLGEQVFTGIKTRDVVPAELDVVGLGKEFKVSTDVRGLGKIDVALIPPGGQARFGGERVPIRLKGDPTTIVKEFRSDIPLKDEFSLPKTTGIQKQIVESLKGTEDIISGSFAQQAQLIKSRQFKDIDILSRDISKTSLRLQEQFGSTLDISQQKISGTRFGEFDILRVRERGSRRVLADIDPFAFAEEGLAPTGKVFDVEGVKLLGVETRLLSKLTQAQRGKILTKTILDIQQLTAGKVDIGQPTIKGAFGFTFEEQLALAGRRVNIGISAIDFAKSLVGDIPLTKPVFGTPSAIGDPFLIRESRLGLGTEFFKFPSPQADVRVQVGGRKSQALILRDILIDTGDVISPKALRKLAKRADLGSEKAISDILRLTKQFETSGSESFVPSAQRRGELEVVKFGGALQPLGQLRDIRVKGQAVELFELGINGKKGKGNGFDFSKGLNKLLKELKQKGFENLPSIKQLDISRGVRRESGFDISRALGRVNIVSPTGLASFPFSAQRLFGKDEGRQFFPTFGRRGGFVIQPPKQTPFGRDTFSTIIPPPTTRRTPPPTTRRTPPPGLPPGRRLPPFDPSRFDLVSDPFIPIRRGGRRRPKKEKRRKPRRRLQFPISVSFTAVATDQFGKFPKSFRVAGRDLGILPGQIRVQPLRGAKRRPSLGGVRARRVSRRGVIKRKKKK